MSDSHRRFNWVLVALLLILPFGYALFEARRYLEGPTIEISSPSPYESVEGPEVTVRGFGKNLSYLYINGAQAYLNEKGELIWVYTPPRGYTTLQARATDRFGREVSVSIPFIVK